MATEIPAEDAAEAPNSTSPVVEIEVVTGCLVTPSVQDVVTGAAVLAGPDSDDQRSWQEYRRTCPDGRYAVAKRTLSPVGTTAARAAEYEGVKGRGGASGGIGRTEIILFAARRIQGLARARPFSYCT